MSDAADTTTDAAAMLRTFLDHMVKIEASDLYLLANSPPVFRVDNVTYPGRVALQAEEVAAMADSLMTPGQREQFASSCELNLTLAHQDGSRFRINVFRERGAYAVVVRAVPGRIKTLDELGHPLVLKDVALSPRGLVLVVGGAGQGKSTTVAAIVDHRNSSATGHILTVEDPIEFIHPHKQCVVTQREVGTDTRSYAHALHNALRQAADVIVIGEIRDSDTMDAALSFAEAGRLCVSTLRAKDANETMERIFSFFAPDRHGEIRLRLSLTLGAVISQRLIPAPQGGRVAALEILLGTPRIKELIKRGEIAALTAAIEQAAIEGCCTFDASLFALVSAGRVREGDALESADDANSLGARLERFRAGGTLRGVEPPLRLLPDPSQPSVVPVQERRSKAILPR